MILFKKKEIASSYKKNLFLNNLNSCPKTNYKYKFIEKKGIKDSVKKLFDSNKNMEQIIRKNLPRNKSSINKKKTKKNISINNFDLKDKLINNIKEKRNYSFKKIIVLLNLKK